MFGQADSYKIRVPWTEDETNDKSYLQPVPLCPFASSLLLATELRNRILKPGKDMNYLLQEILVHRPGFINLYDVSPLHLVSGCDAFCYSTNSRNPAWLTNQVADTRNHSNTRPILYVFKIAISENHHAPSLSSFWRTGWFYTITLAIGAIMVYHIVRLYLKYLRKTEHVDMQLAEMELKALHAQMNPHFVSNCLGSIQQMILADEKENANRYLIKFARLIRLSLHHSQKLFITLNENNEYLQHYLLMEQLRFNNSFTYVIDIDPGINGDEIVFPPLMIQPLVENAIWHGLLEKQGDRQLQIRYKLHKSSLICEIEDNGIGIDQVTTSPREHPPMGIVNIKKRLNLLNIKYELQGSLHITDKKKSGTGLQGTLAVLTLPIINQTE